MVGVPGHPRAGKAAYVFEHILVMEDMLGRYLLPEETVSDAIAWACEILHRYLVTSVTSNNAQDGD